MERIIAKNAPNGVDPALNMSGRIEHEILVLDLSLKLSNLLLYVAFQYEVLPVDVPAWLEVSRAKPFHNLADYLLSLTSPPPLAAALYTQGADNSPLQSEDSQAIARGLQELRTPWTRLLWGPPGAGKTYCSARFAAGLLAAREEERIFLVAPSNVAVDAALAELITALESSEDRIEVHPDSFSSYAAFSDGDPEC